MAKLSKREQAAKKAGGTLNYKTGKISVAPKPSPVMRTTSSKSTSPWGAAGDAISGEGDMTNAQYEQKIATGLGAGTAAKAREEAKLTSSPEKQKKHSSDKNSKYYYTPPAPMQPQAPAPVASQGPSMWDSMKSNFNTAMSGGGARGGAGQIVTSPQATKSIADMGGDFGTKVADSMKDWNFGINTAMAHGPSELDQYLLGGKTPDLLKGSTDSSLRVDPTQAEVPLAPPAPEVGTQFDPMNQPGSNNGGGNMSVDAMGNSVRSGGGGGGKSSGDDGYSAYQKQIRAIQKMQEEAFNNMLDQVDPTYKGYQTDYEQALNDSMEQERQALLARQMSYGTADSEQREQAEGRLTSDFAKQRATFMRQLAEKEAAQRADIGGQRANALSSLGMKSADSMLDAWKYQQAQAQQEFENQLKMMGMRSSGSNSANKTEQEKRMWIDEQKQNWVNSGSYKDGAFNVPDGGREAINARYQSYWGEPNNYAIPDYWEQTIIPSPNYKWVAPTQFEEGYYVDQQGNRVG